MATRRQIAANRRNALKSTGPTSPEGKNAVRLNSLQHGACLAQTLLPGEDPAAFALLRQSYLDLYEPNNPTEHFLVDRIVQAAWRLNRLAAMEVRVIAAHHEAAQDRAALNGEILRLIGHMFAGRSTFDPSTLTDVIVDADYSGAEPDTSDDNDTYTEKSIVELEGATTQERRKRRIEAGSQGGLKAGKNREWARTPISQSGAELTANKADTSDHVANAYIRDSQRGNTIFKFARYQTTLERSYYRAVHELLSLRTVKTKDSITPEN